MTYKTSTILVLKLTLLMMVFMPFWIAPMIFLVGLIGASAESQHWNSWQIFMHALPTIMAYFSMLHGFIKVQQLVYLKKKYSYNFRYISQSNFKSTLFLLAAQFISIVMSNFSPYAFLHAICLQIIYFIVQIQEYVYYKILVQYPQVRLLGSMRM